MPRAQSRQAGRTGVLLAGVLLVAALALVAAPAWAAADPTRPAAHPAASAGPATDSARADPDPVAPLGVPRVTSPPKNPGAPAVDPSGAGYGSHRAKLPTTGLDVGGMVTLGAAMVVAGVLMLTVRRRGPRSTLATLPDDAAYTWHAPTQELPVWHRSPAGFGE